MEVIEILEQLNRDGMTVIMVTHDPELGDRAAAGYIWWTGVLFPIQIQNKSLLGGR